MLKLFKNAWLQRKQDVHLWAVGGPVFRQLFPIQAPLHVGLVFPYFQLFQAASWSEFAACQFVLIFSVNRNIKLLSAGNYYYQLIS